MSPSDTCCALKVISNSQNGDNVSHGTSEIPEGKIRDNSGNFVFEKCWEPY